MAHQLAVNGHTTDVGDSHVAGTGAANSAEVVSTRPTAGLTKVGVMEATGDEVGATPRRHASVGLATKLAPVTVTREAASPHTKRVGVMALISTVAS